MPTFTGRDQESLRTFVQRSGAICIEKSSSESDLDFCSPGLKKLPDLNLQKFGEQIQLTGVVDIMVDDTLKYLPETIGFFWHQSIEINGLVG